MILFKNLQYLDILILIAAGYKAHKGVRFIIFRDLRPITFLYDKASRVSVFG